MKHWIRNDRRVVIKDRWLTLYADGCQLPNGHTLDPYYVIEERDWVHVVAIDSLGEVLVTRQYRYAANVVCTELPCGAVEDDETPLAAANRELKEETGFEAQEWELLSVNYANPARQTNRIYCYIARDLNDSGTRALDVSEDISFEFQPIAEIKNMIQSGEFAQALHVASILMASEYLNKPNKPVQTMPPGVASSVRDSSAGPHV